MLWIITYWFVYLLLPGVMSLVEAAACLVFARYIANLPWSLCQPLVYWIFCSEALG